MITNTGKNIIAKYLIGQAPAYASYIALGCGQRPLKSGIDSFGVYSSQKSLEFEMFRIPITSRGYVTENIYNPDTQAYEDVSMVVLTGELPTEQRYEFTEVGVYSAKSNPSATSNDSRMMLSFSDTENWEYHDETSSVGLGATITKPLYGNTANDIIKPQEAATAQGITVGPVFLATTNNAIFNNTLRVSTNERCRYLNSKIFIPGNMSVLNVDNQGAISIDQSSPVNSRHIHLEGVSTTLATASPSDELRLAMTVVRKQDSSWAGEVTKVLVMVEFASDDNSLSSNYAQMQVQANISATNRYYVASSKLADLVKSPGFTWNSVNIVKVYVSVYETIDDVESISDNHYVCLDGLRFENMTTQNPLYGLTGYTVVKTQDGFPIVKESNTSNLVEFRFGMDVM